MPKIVLLHSAAKNKMPSAEKEEMQFMASKEKATGTGSLDFEELLCELIELDNGLARLAKRKAKYQQRARIRETEREMAKSQKRKDEIKGMVWTHYQSRAVRTSPQR